MIVFKTFLKVLNKCKVPIIIYTVCLIFFAGFNMQTNENSTSFVASKPDVLIINQDEEIGITKSLMEYIKQNCNIVEIEDKEEARNDALFYRDVNYMIYIPKNYREDFLAGNHPKLEVKSTGDYQASLAEMMLEKYVRVANLYQKMLSEENEIIKNTEETLAKQTQVEITSKLDTDNLSKATFYYNFANYSILAGCVYVICLVLSSFQEEKIRKRTIVSSMKDKIHNRYLLLANSLFAVILWAGYVILSRILIGDIIFSAHGLMYIVNSFVFTICAVTISFVIANLVNNKNAINGIVNVVALGSSFLCGAFVPMEWLPDSVLKIAHILPSYYYISTNEALKELEVINLETLKPILANMGILLGFAMGFVILRNILSKKKENL